MFVSKPCSVIILILLPECRSCQASGTTLSDANLLTNIWTDELVIEEVWKDFMKKLVSEWVEFVLYVSYAVLSWIPKTCDALTHAINWQATVMLTANVAFLAIQGVVPQSGSGWISAPHAQIASSISLVFSFGSITTGLLLIRRNRTMATQDTQTAVRLLSSFLRLTS